VQPCGQGQSFGELHDVPVFPPPHPTLQFWSTSVTHWPSHCDEQQYESAAHTAAAHCEHDGSSAAPEEHSSCSHPDVGGAQLALQ